MSTTEDYFKKDGCLHGEYTNGVLFHASMEDCFREDV